MSVSVDLCIFIFITYLKQHSLLNFYPLYTHTHTRGRARRRARTRTLTRARAHTYTHTRARAQVYCGDEGNSPNSNSGLAWHCFERFLPCPALRRHPSPIGGGSTSVTRLASHHVHEIQKIPPVSKPMDLRSSPSDTIYAERRVVC